MRIHTLPGDPGRQQKVKRVGRGESSGHGKTSTKGNKGHKARNGGGKRGSFEGGQMPLIRRMPKFGFNNPFRVSYEAVNVGSLEKHFESGETVDIEALIRVRLVTTTLPVKLLANGELTKKLTVKLAKASEAAIKKVTAVGGSFEPVA